MLNVVVALFDPEFREHFNRASDAWFKFWDSGSDFSELDTYNVFDNTKWPEPDWQLAAAWIGLTRCDLSDAKIRDKYEHVLRHIIITNTFNNKWQKYAAVLEDYFGYIALEYGERYTQQQRCRPAILDYIRGSIMVLNNQAQKVCLI